MPLVKQQDQTLALTPQDTNTNPTLDLNIPGLPPRYNASGFKPASVAPQAEAPAQPGNAPRSITGSARSEFEARTGLILPDELATGLDIPDFSQPERLAKDSFIGDDILSGFANGVLGENFVSSTANHLESWTGANARIMFTDENGKWTTPYYLPSHEYAGKTEIEWDNMSAKDRRIATSKATKDRIQKTYDSDPDTWSYKIANLTGMLVDPTTFIPILGQTLKARAASGAAVGGTDMGVYQSSQEGAPTAFGVGLGLILGGGLSALSKARRAGNTDPKVRADAGKNLDLILKDLDAEVKLAQQKKLSPAVAMDSTLRKFGIDSDKLDAMILDSGHSSSRHLPHAVRKVSTFDRALEPISERMKRINPRAWKKAQDLERRTHEQFHKMTTIADDFIRKDLDSLVSPVRKGVLPNPRYNPQAYKEIKVAMLTNDVKAFKELAQKYLPKGWRKNYANYLHTIRSAYKMMKTHRKFDSTPLGKAHKVYLHRAVKDHSLINKVLNKEERSHLEKLIDSRFPTGATDDELNKLYSDYFSGKLDLRGTKSTPSGSKSRRLTKKDFEEHPELVDAFHDPARATHSYLREVVEDAQIKEFFGDNVVKKHGDNLTTGEHGSFADLARQEIEKGRMSFDDADEFKKLLQLRFVDGVRGPNKAIQMFKDISYSSLLGNPISAVTQLGDLALATAKYGVRNTLSATVQSLGGRGFTAKEFGLIDSILEEMVSDVGTKKLLSKSLSLSGFSKVDQLGKAVNMNAAFKRAVRQTKSTKGLVNLHAKWGRAYGDEFADLVTDLSQGKITDRTKTLVFAELADVQPITLLEMPEYYLKFENARLVYMLKTFSLKYFNMLRQHSFGEFKRGNYTAGIHSGTMLLGTFIVGGMATDRLKAAFLGRDYYAEDSLINNMFKTTGFVDRYAFDKMSASSDPMGKLVENLAPPINVLSPAVVAARNLAVTGELQDVDAFKLIGQLPVIGKLIQNFLGDGMEEHNARQWHEKVNE